MELVQWIVPGADGALHVGWAPAWADRLTSLGAETRPLRRRGAPLVSRWLAHPISVGAVDDESRDEARVLVPLGAISLSFLIALDVPSERDLVRLPVPDDADDVRFAGVYSELVRVVADLCESAGLPPTSIAPLPERRGLEVAVAPVHGAAPSSISPAPAPAAADKPTTLGTVSLDALADAIVLVRAAVELCMHARGLKLVDARVRCLDKIAPADGRTRAFLGSAFADRGGITPLNTRSMEPT